MIGSLLEKLIIAVKLDLDDFDDEIDEAGDKVDDLGQRSEGSFGRMGRSWGAVGAKVVVGVAALGSAAIAAGAAFASMANDIAQQSRDLANAAQVAGEGFEEFQRQAFAASSVGIEFEGLSDIFKDVRERVGEFVVTGGGPLQDAFDALNGKVRLTVDELRGLSGRDGLQLIVNRMQEAELSTEEMSFVFESLGSEATRLLPLLLNNGEAMDRLGESAAIISDEDRARLAEYTAAQMQFSQALREVQIALVTSGLLEGLVELTRMTAEGISQTLDLAQALGVLGDDAQRAAGGLESLQGTELEWLANLAGQMQEAFGPEMAALMERIQGHLEEIFDADAAEGFEELIPLFIELGRVQLQVISVTVEVVASIIKQIGNLIAFVTSIVSGDWRGAWDAATAFFDEAITAMLNILANFAPEATEHLRQVWQGAKRWLDEAFGGIVDAVIRKLEDLNDAFAWLYNEVVGNSHVPDMVQRIGEEMARLQELMVDPAVAAAEDTEEAFRNLAQNTESLIARLFPVATRISDIRSELELLNRAVDAGILSPDLADEARDRLREQSLEARADLRGERPVSIGGSQPLDTIDSAGLTSLLDTMIDLPPIATRAQEALEEFAFGMGDAINNALISVLEGRDFFDSLKRAFFVSMSDIAVSALGDLNNALFGERGLGGVLGGLFTGILGGGSRAVGGPIIPGRAYDVGYGEKFVASAHGRILSRNDAMEAMGGGERVEIAISASPEFDVKMRRVAENSASAAVAGYDRVVGSRVQKNLKRRG